MTRLGAMAATTVALLFAGCGYELYEKRMEDTVGNLKKAQRADTLLEKPAQGKLRELSVFVRIPKPLTETNYGLPEQAGLFDYAATFTGAPSSPAPKVGENPVVLPPMTLHILARAKPKKATPKKGEAAPPPDPNAAARGDFVADVRQVLAGKYGADAVGDKSPQNNKADRTTFRKMVFNAPDGSEVRVYFADANKKELETALIFEIPQGLMKNEMVTDAVPLAVDQFAIGPKAPGLFDPRAARRRGKTDDGQGVAF